MKRTLMLTLLFAATIGLAGTAGAADGAAIFKAKCAACHGAGGKGTAMAPAFAGNEWIKGADKADIAATIKNGRQGAAKKYKKFAIGMPAQKAMPDGDVEALVGYLKDLASK
ncbi:MAG: c-type cytochrome [Thermodesulfobacteriota bacterium]